jgi:hypothetical protein
MEETAIVIRDPAIIAYYRENPQLDIVAMNHIFIDIFKNLSTNLSATLNSTIHAKILDMVTDIQRNVSNFKSDIMMAFNDRLMQTKKEYVEDLKLQLTNNFLTNNEKISLVMDKTTETILSKTSALIHEILPKSQDRTFAQIENCIRTCCSNIEQDTKQLLETKHSDESSSKNILDNIEHNFSKMITSLQTPIFTLIQSSEERTVAGIQSIKQEVIQYTRQLLESKHSDEPTTKNIVGEIEKAFGQMVSGMQTPMVTLIQSNEERTSSGIQSIKQELFQQKTSQERLNGQLNEFLNKYTNNSSTKGIVSENELFFMLQSIFPSDEVLHVGNEAATCDFRVNRKLKGKPTILFENKDYNRPVSTGEVTKFERDLQTQRHHGIFVSQKTGITYKDNFQIDIIQGLIHVYVPYANYDTDKLKIAVDLIDNLSEKLQVIAASKGETIYETNKRELDELAIEYQQFAIRKSTLEDSIKQLSKQLLDQVNEMQLPKLGDLLEKFEIIEPTAKCPACPFRGKRTKASLGAHCHRCPAFLELKKTNPELATYYEEQAPEGKRKKASPKTKGKKLKEDSTVPPLDTSLSREEGI